MYNSTLTCSLSYNLLHMFVPFSECRAMQKERGHVLDVLSMADHHDGISRRGHRKLKAPSGMGDIVSSVSGTS